MNTENFLKSALPDPETLAPDIKPNEVVMIIQPLYETVQATEQDPGELPWNAIQ